MLMLMKCNAIKEAKHLGCYSHLLKGVKHGHIRAGRDPDVDDDVTLKKSI
jgi:hypothetical protein